MNKDVQNEITTLFNEDMPSQSSDFNQTYNNDNCLSDEHILGILSVKINEIKKKHSTQYMDGVRRSKSPRLAVTLNNNPTVCSIATIDEGSELKMDG